MKRFRLVSFVFIIIFNKSALLQNDFTIILIPDTQYESRWYPAAFNSQTQWIVDNKNTKNIVFVTHVGDIVDAANSTSQWNNADAAMDKLDAGNVPYSVGPGNHDIGDGSLYESYFGVSRFAGKSWYAGNYGGDNYNNYSLFSASGMDFIVINLQYQPTEKMLEWADGLLKSYPNRRGIVETHEILMIDNSWFSEYIYLALKDNPNLFLMVCGHDWGNPLIAQDGAAYRAESGDDGHTIHIMLADYQGYDLSGDAGYLRILRFSPPNNKIYATTYSPYKNKYITSYPDQLEMVYDMRSSSNKILVETKVFLEGPYDIGTHEMTTMLKSEGLIPNTSPYTEDPRTVTVPANVTDWILVQLQNTSNGSALVSRSAFLYKDGRIVADDGITGQIEMNTSPGNYFVVLKHRNHLSVMSNSLLTFSSFSTVTSYDFTTGSAKFYGGGNGAVELENGVWGMIAGDANGSSVINATDYLFLKSQSGSSGYFNGDCNLSGTVNATDYLVIKPNSGKSSPVP